MTGQTRGRSRRWTVVIASALVLAGAALAIRVLGVPGSEQQPWESSWASSRSSTTLVVRATGQDGIAHECGPPQLRFAVEETATLIRITARAVRFTGEQPFVRGLPYFGLTGCADVGYGPTPHALELARPIGDRTIVDGATGAARPFFDATSAATISNLPQDLATTDLGLDGIAPEHTVFRSWSTRGAPVRQWAYLVTSSDPKMDRLSGGRFVDVAGTRVQISSFRTARIDVFDLQWSPTAGGRAFVSLHLAHGRWTDRDALEVVRNLSTAR